MKKIEIIIRDDDQARLVFAEIENVLFQEDISAVLTILTIDEQKEVEHVPSKN